MSDPQVAAVIGGGGSGVLASVALMAAGRQVVLVDPQSRPGRGIAYSTQSPWHLLNSPAGSMSAFPDRPDDFVRWCRRRRPETEPGDFMPRSLYGDYLSDTLSRAHTDRLTMHRGYVSRIFASGRGGFTVLLADDVVIPAAQVVLAVGNAPPAHPQGVNPRLPSYVGDPWRADALSEVDGGHVLLIGTGLTAYDVALTLVRANPRVRITAVSRHGLTPQQHRRSNSPAHARVTLGSPARILRELRRQSRESGDWRSVMDAHRPHWNTLWTHLSEPEQLRFLEHIARYWEVHRHRVAPAVGEEIAALQARGALRFLSGGVCHISPEPTGELTATLRCRGETVTETFTAVVNCTGPGRIVASNPLVRSLVAEGLARPGPHGLGLDTDAHGALIRRDGSVNSALWTLGPPRRGVLWETTAVPEIRSQAWALAERIDAHVSATASHG